VALELARVMDSPKAGNQRPRGSWPFGCKSCAVRRHVGVVAACRSYERLPRMAASDGDQLGSAGTLSSLTHRADQPPHGINSLSSVRGQLLTRRLSPDDWLPLAGKARFRATPTGAELVNALLRVAVIAGLGPRILVSDVRQVPG
jgi:hypothetical protein